MTKKMLLTLTQKNRPLIIAFLFFIGAFVLFNSGPEKNTPTADKIYADTLIPKGYVLVPIELANADTIAALVDQFGVIDLYAGSPTSQGSKKIAAKVKLLRAPMNPQQYAVLVPEHLSNVIMKAMGPFWAVVQNRQTQSEQKAETAVKQISIEYYKGG